MAKILFAEDDSIFAEAVSSWLTAERYDVEWVATGSEALERLTTYSYDAVILDWQLPGAEGVEVCRQYRKQGGRAPVIMLTGLSAIDSKIEGLDSGADDYLTKPFAFTELLARLRALLRRPADYTDAVITVGAVSVDTRSRVVTAHSAVVKLQPKEYAILAFLIRHPNKVFSAEEILNRVWKDSAGVSAESLYTYIKTLRKKLSADGSASPIRTVHGQGYCYDSA